MVTKVNSERKSIIDSIVSFVKNDCDIYDFAPEIFVSYGVPQNGYIPFHDGLIRITVPWYFTRETLSIKCDDKFQKTYKVYEQINKLVDDIPCFYYDDVAKYHILWTKDYFKIHYKDCKQKINKHPISFDCEDFIYWYSEECPAYINYYIIFDDKNKIVTIKSCLNNDYCYNRESVGSWAGKSADGEPIGDHDISCLEVEYENKTFVNSIKKALQMIFKTVEI